MTIITDMIRDFIDYWPLFQNTYLAGWLIAIVLGLIGVLTVARDQIFIGAAITEASSLGIALGMTLCAWFAFDEGHWMADDIFHRAMAVLFSIIATLLTVPGISRRNESHEAITGWVFLLSSSGAVLLMAHSPHGLEEIHRILFSSIIGATVNDVWMFAVLALLTALGMGWKRRTLLLITMDAPTAAALGVRTTAWSFAMALWIGLLVGLAIRVSGTLFTFGCLVLPALIAKNLCREVGSMLVAAPIIALLTAIASFVVAHHRNLPPGQMTVASLCVLLALAWGIRFVRAKARPA